MVEAAAKAIFWNQCNIMHDHEEEWRSPDTHAIMWRESARAALEAAYPERIAELESALKQKHGLTEIIVAEKDKRIAELERDNEALRATISDMRRDLLELTGEKT